jgi:thiol-disulfide isomerase/thioredoxin/YHS domain-containing protein
MSYVKGNTRYQFTIGRFFRIFAKIWFQRIIRLYRIQHQECLFPARSHDRVVHATFLKGISEVKAPSVVFWLILALMCGVAFADSGSSQIRWAPDLVSARDASAKFKVPLLIHFYGERCLPCKTLEQRVLSHPEVIGTLNKYFICIAVNATTQPGVAAEFGVHSWPTDLFLSPDGEVLFGGVCPQDVRNYMGILNNVAVMNRDRNLMMASREEKASNLSSSQQANAPEANSFQSGSLSSQPPAGGQLEPRRNEARPLNASGQSTEGKIASGGGPLDSLPSLGAQTQARTNNTNFYATSSQHQGQHQLAQGAVAQPTIQGGPLMPSSQPHSIVGSIQDAGQASVEVKRQSLSLDAVPFPPLPGLEATRPVRHAEPVQEQLANLPAVPSVSKVVGQFVSASDPESTLPTKLSSSKSPAYSADSDDQGGYDQLDAQWSDILDDGPQTIVIPDPSAVLSARNDSGPSAQATGGSDQATGGNDQPTGGRDQLADTEQASSEQSEQETVVALPCLDGFCPVALRQQQWIAGDSQYSVRHLGKLYTLSSRSAVEAFLQNPDAYAPLLSGFDPLVLLYQGELVEGSTQHGLFEGNTGQVLLFSSAESKNEFQRNFEKNMRAVQAILQRAEANSSN